jgi:hypothetical protein
VLAFNTESRSCEFPPQRQQPLSAGGRQLPLGTAQRLPVTQTSRRYRATFLHAIADELQWNLRTAEMDASSFSAGLSRLQKHVAKTVIDPFDTKLTEEIV